MNAAASLPPKNTMLILLGVGAFLWLQNRKAKASTGAATGSKTLTNNATVAGYYKPAAMAGVTAATPASQAINTIMALSNLVTGSAARSIVPATSRSTDNSSILSNYVPAFQWDFGYSGDAAAINPAPGSTYSTDAFQSPEIFQSYDNTFNAAESIGPLDSSQNFWQ